MDIAALDFLVAVVAGKILGGNFVGGFLESGTVLTVLLEVFLRVVLGEARSSQFCHGEIFLNCKKINIRKEWSQWPIWAGTRGKLLM